MSSFPDDWPPGCPPADAQAASGLLYRLVKSNPATASDFLTHADLGKMPKAPPCLRVGLSVFRTRDDVVHQAELFPFLGNQVASGEVCSEHGKTKLTPGKMPSHTTWWPYLGVDRVALFPTVEGLR